MVIEAIEKMTVGAFQEMTFDDDNYYELLNGEIVRKKAPTPQHQEAVGNLFTIFNNYAKEKQLGKCYTSPIDVFFDDYNCTQPDILFIKTDRAFIITNNGIEGAPDLVVEVLSPSTFRYDRKEKMAIYKQFGVKEYWIVDTNNRAIEVYVLQDGLYDMQFFAIEEGTIESSVLEGLKLDITQVF